MENEEHKMITSDKTSARNMPRPVGHRLAVKSSQLQCCISSPYKTRKFCKRLGFSDVRAGLRPFGAFRGSPGWSRWDQHESAKYGQDEPRQGQSDDEHT